MPACVRVCVRVCVCACVYVYVYCHTHHRDKDGEGGYDLGNEPMCRLDVLLAVQHLVEDGEPLCLLFALGATDVALDLLLKFWTSSLLLNSKQEQ